MLILIGLILALFNQCSALKCKIGYANQKSGEHSTIGNCEEKNTPNAAQHCFSVLCIEQNFTSTALLSWGCSADADKNGCEQFFENASNAILHTTKQRCECQFGEKGKDLANEQVKLPKVAENGTNASFAPMPLNESIQCRAGYFRGNGFGRTVAKECVGAEYCYAVSCQIASENFTFWGCALDNDCETLSKQFAFGHKCNCQISAKGENMANLDGQNPKYLPYSKMSQLHVVFNNVSIPSGQLFRANVPIFIVLPMIAFGFVTKFLAMR